MSLSPPFFNFYIAPDVAMIVKNSKPHSLESMREGTGNDIYDWWKQVLLANLEPQELENLYSQKEF